MVSKKVARMHESRGNGRRGSDGGDDRCKDRYTMAMKDFNDNRGAMMPPSDRAK